MTWQDSFENLGWGLRNLFSRGESIIGPNEALPPTDITIRDIRDYSGTASINEISCLIKRPGTEFHNIRILKNDDRFATQPVFKLGRFLKIAKGRVTPSEDIWLQEKSIYKNVAIIGSPGSGKTEGFIIPGIKTAIDAGLSNIVIDVKGGSLIDKLGHYAEQKGVRVIYWSCLPQEVARSHSINLLDNINSLQDAQILAKSLYGNTETLGENQQYGRRDVIWLAQWIMLLKHVLGNTATLKNVYEIAENPVIKLRELLQHCRDNGLRASIESQLRLMVNNGESEQAFTWAIQDAISFFSWTNFEQVTGHSDILLRDIQHRPTLLVIGAELAGRDVSKKISSALIDILMTIFYERWTQDEGGRAIVFWIDEFPRIQKQIDITEFSSVARSAKGSIVIAAQSIEQIDPEYREQLMENFDTTILCRGVGYSASEWLSNRVGNRSQNVQRRRYHESNPNDEFPWLRTRSARERYETWRESTPVLDAREIQYPVGNQYVAVIHSRTACRKPFLVDYERAIEPGFRWLHPQRARLIWRDSSEQRSLPDTSRTRLLNWRDSNAHEEQDSSERNSSRLNWRN